MAIHRDLADDQLHEPKGVAAASANTVYRANGSGTGTWTLLTAQHTTVADPNNVFTGTNVEAVLYELYQHIDALQDDIVSLGNDLAALTLRVEALENA